MKKLFIILVLLVAGCGGIPEHIRPVNNFNIEKYLGKWYEIARLDNSFEQDLTRITAEYSLGADGSIKVINRGYLASENKWQEAEGKAYFVDKTDQAYLEVSFFGPLFYDSYIVFELDHENYQYALVTSSDKSDFWILSREPKIKEEIKKVLIAKATALGFETSELIFVKHD